jgi:NADH dehydrogenase [ubiquinone] 1 alpha subcomplex assembly factor 7
MVTAQDDALMFALAPAPVPVEVVPASLRDAPLGSVFETSPASQAIVSEVTRRVLEQDGLALIIDYGHSQTSAGDTFQAVKENRYADLLSQPGEADLTVHVDFAALSRVAVDGEGIVFGPTPQGSFLSLLGIEARADQLRRASPIKAEEIDAAIDRLVNPAQMGATFKVLALTSASASTLPGFSR